MTSASDVVSEGTLIASWKIRILLVAQEVFFPMCKCLITCVAWDLFRRNTSCGGAYRSFLLHMSSPLLGTRILSGGYLHEKNVITTKIVDFMGGGTPPIKPSNLMISEPFLMIFGSFFMIFGSFLMIFQLFLMIFGVFFYNIFGFFGIFWDFLDFWDFCKKFWDFFFFMGVPPG